jgi:predicted ATPase
MTVLAGINSSGKSSLLQALLLLKQSMESDTKDLLRLNGPYVAATSLTDLVRMKKRGVQMKMAMTIDGREIPSSYRDVDFSPNGKALVAISFELVFSANGQSHLESLNSTWKFEGTEEKVMFSAKRSKALGTYTLKYSHPAMLGLSESEKRRTMDKCKLTFRDFIPIFAEAEAGGGNVVRSLIVMKVLYSIIESVMENIHYVGAQRIKPKLAQSYSNTDFREVGTDGQMTRFLLNERKNAHVAGYDDNVGGLAALCKKWICDKMHLAKDIDVVKDSNKLYRTLITNNDGLQVDLCQMGFGLSQILPFVVQGFLTPVGGTLIVEDPDVHMHPKVQADIVDFFIDLMQHGRNVLIETHSDHIVTRLRRRITDETLTTDKVNIIFVENGKDGSSYPSIGISENGAFTSELPKDFLDTQNNDNKEILRERIKKQNKGQES